MKNFVCTRMFKGKTITAEVIVTDSGVQIGLFGGDKPHIGAVGIINPDGQISVTQFESHREGILCKQWCQKLASAGICPVVMSAGVHYDHINRDEIFQLVDQCTDILADVQEQIPNLKKLHEA